MTTQKTSSLTIQMATLTGAALLLVTAFLTQARVSQAQQPALRLELEPSSQTIRVDDPLTITARVFTPTSARACGAEVSFSASGPLALKGPKTATTGTTGETKAAFTGTNPGGDAYVTVTAVLMSPPQSTSCPTPIRGSTARVAAPLTATQRLNIKVAPPPESALRVALTLSSDEIEFEKSTEARARLTNGGRPVPGAEIRFTAEPRTVTFTSLNGLGFAQVTTNQLGEAKVLIYGRQEGAVVVTAAFSTLSGPTTQDVAGLSVVPLVPDDFPWWIVVVVIVIVCVGTFFLWKVISGRHHDDVSQPTPPKLRPITDPGRQTIDVHRPDIRIEATFIPTNEFEWTKE